MQAVGQMARLPNPFLGPIASSAGRPGRTLKIRKKHERQRGYSCAAQSNLKEDINDSAAGTPVASLSDVFGSRQALLFDDLGENGLLYLLPNTRPERRTSEIITHTPSNA